MVARLADRRDHAGVVRLVEAWVAQGTPTHRARLAQGRAFHALRLMDRAMARAREVLEVDAASAEALRLLAEVYLDRGWPVKARKPLETLRDLPHPPLDRADVDALWARAHQDPARPESNARELEREGDPARMLALAEAFLATGSFLRATGILERLRRVDPERPRIRELLWGLAGEFGSGGLSLDALAASLLPASARAPAREAPDEPEHTESLRLTPRRDEPGDLPENANFPALFKYAAASEDDEGEPAEATQTSGMATVDEMAQGGTGNTDPGQNLAGGAAGDTQIRLVLRPGEGAPPAAHRRRDEGGGGLRDTLNLRAYQESMGMSTAAESDLDESSTDLLEEEDEDVVVMTRPESAAAAAPEAPATYAKPIVVIEKHATPPPPAPDPIPPDEPFEYERPARTLLEQPVVWVLAAFVLAFAVLVGALALGSFAPRPTSALGAREDLLRAVAIQDYNALLQQEGRLDQRVRAGEGAAVTAALAQAQLLIWSEYNGDPSRINAVRAVLRGPLAVDPHRAAVLRAEDALAGEDLAGATAAIGRERPQDDEERLLFARIAASSGDLTRAMGHLQTIEDDELPRYRLARAQILAGAGRGDEAREQVQAVLKVAPDHVAAQLLQLELAPSEPAKTLLDVDIYLNRQRDRGLPPRLEGRAHLLRARSFAARGDANGARDAVAEGLARDGTNPQLLYWAAGDHARRQELVLALRDADTILATRPGNARAQAAKILLLLDLDRIDEAGAALDAGRLLGDLRPVLATLVSVCGRGEPPATTLPPLPPTPLGAYAAALAAHQGRSPDALAAIQRGLDALTASPDPFERRLAPRLLALRVLASDPGSVERYVREAEKNAGDDPLAHVYLGRYFEGARRRALAAQHFDRAPQLGAEVGVAWYEKGRFYMDARDDRGRSEEAWQKYLALAPTGPRAVRARDTLGVR